MVISDLASMTLCDEIGNYTILYAVPKRIVPELYPLNSDYPGYTKASDIYTLALSMVQFINGLFQLNKFNPNLDKELHPNFPFRSLIKKMLDADFSKRLTVKQIIFELTPND